MSSNTPHDLKHYAPIQFEPGLVIMDKFKVIELLGSGGMGSVFKVQHMHLKTFYALKCLNHKQSNDAIWRRFENEARAANRLDHPNLIRVHDSGLLSDGQPYVVMDFVDGTTLAHELSLRGTLSLSQALKIFIQVGFALAYAHTNGVIHRDIKPSNIMMVKCASASLGGTVKVVDFGIAKLTGTDEYNQMTLTRTGEIFGSPLYMSPEQCIGIAVDQRSDLYSLGCVIYEALTGTPPVVGDNALSTMLKHQNEIPPLMRQASMGLEFPDSIEYVVAKLLEKDPNKRYQNASLLTADLVAIEQGQMSPGNVQSDAAIIPTPQVGAKKNRRKQENTPTLLLVALSLLTGFTLGFITAKTLTQEPKSPIEHLTKSKQYDPYENAMSYDESKVENLFSNLDAKPFSKIADNGSTRVFTFPIHEKFGTICKDDWNIDCPALGVITRKPFHPFNLSVDSDVCGSPIIFEKFRPDEISGIRMYGFAANIDKILKILSKYQNLRSLSFENSNVISSDIEYLNMLKPVVELNLKGTELSGIDLCKLKWIGQVENLNISVIRNASAVLQKLKGSKKLRKLSVSTCVLTEDDIKTIATFGRLERLEIGNNKAITAKTLAMLTAMNLNYIGLEDCEITDEMAACLRASKTLKHVRISTRGLSDSRVKVLIATIYPVKVEVAESTQI